MAGVRAETLYKIDKACPLRFSHENPAVQKVYEEYLGKPLSEKAHHLLHTNHESWSVGV
jgi:NADH-quinone oxidoreductase subunit G